MKLSTLTIQQLQLELGIRDKNKSMWRAAYKELERRCQQPPDISGEPAIVEALEALSKRK